MITIISGSARKNSNTLKAAKAIEKLVTQAGWQAQIIDFNGFDIPNFNQPFDPENLTIWQQSLIANMEKSSLIFMLSPEYNWMPSAEIIQFINRFGSEKFKPIWDKKIFAMIGVSAGKGGKIPALYLTQMVNKIVSFLDLDSFVFSSIQEIHDIQQLINQEGDLLENEIFNASFAKFVTKVLNQAKKTSLISS